MPHILDLVKPLFDKIESGNLEQVRHEVAQLNVEVSNMYDMPYYQNALFKAIMIANEGPAFDMVRFLVEAGCKSNYVDYLKQTPLYYAAREGKSKIVKYLIDHGCNVNHVDTYGQTPLFYIAKNNHLETANLMIEQGADPDFVDHNAQTPIYYAIKANHFDMCEFLL